VLEFETALWRKGHRLVAGIDEAGRGPLAGPVVAAACMIPEGFVLKGINDSKQLTADEREYWYTILTGDPHIQWAVGFVESDEIDRINIYQATLLAMRYAVEGLSTKPDALLVDGMPFQFGEIPAQKVIKGDTLSQAIAAASVLAKVSRDRKMVEWELRYPGYGFGQHKGYGTPQHLQALQRLGPTPIHRRSFSPVREELPCEV